MPRISLFLLVAAAAVVVVAAARPVSLLERRLHHSAKLFPRGGGLHDPPLPQSNVTVTEICKHQWCLQNPSLPHCAIPAGLAATLLASARQFQSYRNDIMAFGANQGWTTEAQNGHVFDENIGPMITDSFESCTFILPQTGFPIDMTCYPQGLTKAEFRTWATTFQAIDGGDFDVGSWDVSRKDDHTYRVVARIRSLGFSEQFPTQQLVDGNNILYHELIETNGQPQLTRWHILSQNFFSLSDIPSGPSAALGTPIMACQSVLGLPVV